MFSRAAVVPALSARRGDRKIDPARRAYVTLGAAGIVVHGSFALAGATNALIDNWLYCGLFFLAAAGCAHSGLRSRAARPWVLAAVGVAIWGIAEIVFRVLAATPRSLYPSATEVLLFVAFSLAYTTLGLLALERVRQFDPVLALDGALAGLAAAALAALLLFPTVSHHPNAAPPRLFLLGAVIGLMFVVTVLGMSGWRPGQSWALILGAILVNVAGDVVLVHLVNSGHFHRGSAADTLFVSSALLIGLASFYPNRHAPIPHTPGRRLAAPLDRRRRCPERGGRSAGSECQRTGRRAGHGSAGRDDRPDVGGP